MVSWWQKEGVRFECQGSGKCCVSRGQYGYVYLTIEDRRALAKHFGLTTQVFTKKFCDRDESGIWKIKDFQESCRFLENNSCSVYSARPTQCRTWPFWPEVMGAKTWAKDVASYCPGVGKGKIWSPEEIANLLKRQKKSEADYGS